jgi:hypothetical protein
MPTTTAADERRALNRWARNQGWADFDAYTAAGGSVLQAMQDIRRNINELGITLTALRRLAGPEPTEAEIQQSQNRSATVVGPEALAKLEAEHYDEPTDADNAQIQGFDHAGD